MCRGWALPAVIAPTPKPPYFAVIFTSLRTDVAADDGYEEMAARMVALAAEQPGFLGLETVKGKAGDGITVSYWTDLASIKRWKAHTEHIVAQKMGREKWYARYHLRIAEVQRDYGVE